MVEPVAGRTQGAGALHGDLRGDGREPRLQHRPADPAPEGHRRIRQHVHHVPVGQRRGRLADRFRRRPDRHRHRERAGADLFGARHRQRQAECAAPAVRAALGGSERGAVPAHEGLFGRRRRIDADDRAPAGPVAIVADAARVHARDRQHGDVPRGRGRHAAVAAGAAAGEHADGRRPEQGQGGLQQPLRVSGHGPVAAAGAHRFGDGRSAHDAVRRRSVRPRVSAQRRRPLEGAVDRAAARPARRSLAALRPRVGSRRDDRRVRAEPVGDRHAGRPVEDLHGQRRRRRTAASARLLLIAGRHDAVAFLDDRRGAGRHAVRRRVRGGLCESGGAGGRRIRRVRRPESRPRARAARFGAPVRTLFGAAVEVA
ncbi:hypothetical protein BCEN4_1220015 [Burkholderia cenocepacia]|nr:hypothetical protein BCEN4_1220015 [Burkholderia cenocepacia]